MRFIGNKEKLVDWIYYEIKSFGVKDGIFFDFFSGTTNVAKHFKRKGYQIVSSDCVDLARVSHTILLVASASQQ